MDWKKIALLGGAGIVSIGVAALALKVTGENSPGGDGAGNNLLQTMQADEYLEKIKNERDS